MVVSGTIGSNRGTKKGTVKGRIMHLCMPEKMGERREDNWVEEPMEQQKIQDN